MNKLNYAIILAAGRGVRMIPLTNLVPKAMAPFKDSTIIADGIKKINKHIKHTYITVGYKGAILAEHVIEMGVDAVFNTSGKGNAWWIYNTLIKDINEPVLVLTCDNIIILDYNKIINEYYALNEPACMVVPVKPIEGIEGDYIFQKNNIVQKLDRDNKAELYCSGIQVLNPHKINKLTNKVDDFYVVWKQLININQLYSGTICPDHWYTVDTMDQLNKLNNS